MAVGSVAVNYGAPPPGGFGSPGFGPPGPPTPPGGPGGGYGGGYGPPPMTAPAPNGAFPQRLVDAPRENRIDETFGWFPASVVVTAGLGILGGILSAIQNDGFELIELELVGGAVLAILLFGFWEISRRLRPTSLVYLGGRLGIYRKGVLEGVVSFGQITQFRLNIVNTLRELLLFGIGGLGGLTVGAATLAHGQLAQGLWCFAVGAGGLLAFASAIWSRAMSHHYYIPKGNRTETVVLRTSELRRIGWPL